MRVLVVGVGALGAGIAATRSVPTALDGQVRGLAHLRRGGLAEASCSHPVSGHVSYRALRKVIAEGQVALTASEAVIGEDRYVIFDLWRVEDGKVVEHISRRQRAEKSPFDDNPRM